MIEPWQHPTGQVPETVAIVALGNSRQDFDFQRLMKGAQDEFSEIWAVNRGLRLHRHHVAFVLDDLQREAYFDPPYGEAIKNHTTPVITSTFYPEFGKHIFEYPLALMTQWAASHHVRPYFKNSIPMMISYACLIGVKRLLIHGADYTLPNGMQMEPSRANVEYWCAVAESNGMDVGISPNCRLLGRQDFPDEYVYGFDQPQLAQAKVRQGIEAYKAQQNAANG